MSMRSNADVLVDLWGICKSTINHEIQAISRRPKGDKAASSQPAQNGGGGGKPNIVCVLRTNERTSCSQAILTVSLEESHFRHDEEEGDWSL